MIASPEPSPFTPNEPDLPATAEAVADGALDPDHITIIDKTVNRLRRVAPSLPPAMIDEAEHQLAGLARHRTPHQTAEAAHEILLRHDPDGEGPHDTDRPAEELRLHTSRDGTLTGRFRFAEPDTAEAIRSAIEARTPPPEPDTNTTILQPGRELHERRGEALRTLVDDADADADDGATDGATDATDATDAPTEHEDDEPHPDDGTDTAGLRVVDHDHDDHDDHDHHDDHDDHDHGDDPLTDSPADEYGPTPKRPAPQTDPSTATSRGPARDRPNRETTMIVTVGLDVLTGATHRTDPAGPRPRQGTAAHPGFGLLDGRYTLSPDTARRLACDAAIVPAVLGTRGEILDLARKTRVVSTAQRRAVIARDHHCAHPGCRRSPRRCDIHHIIPWFLGGRTDLHNLVLLCPYHHHQQHHSGWEIRLRDGVPWFIPPAWLDPNAAELAGRGGGALAGTPPFTELGRQEPA